MGFFKRKAPAPTRINELPDGIDEIILNMGRLTDEAILESFAQARAESIAFRRTETERLEKQYPGYQDELARQRQAMGLKAD